jgi:hypothetical protein
MLKKPMALTESQKKAALLLYEAVTDPLSHSDVRKALGDQLNDMHPNDWTNVQDVYGDENSSDVVFNHNSQLFKAPYSLGTTNGKRTAEIDEDAKINVVPHTTYEEEADEGDSIAGIESAAKTAKLYTSLPTYERFIAKSERDAADPASFAGKGKSFPILKPGDIKAAVSSMGRAGSDNVGTGTLKKNIIAIAKKKGWTKYLPKAWQGGAEPADNQEALRKTGGGTMKLWESAASLETIKLVEAKADYPIKLIAPGAGSSAFYPKEVLQRDGPKVFKAGTHVYLNHPTAAEESARPEGDIKNLAGVLTQDAVYHEAHAQGPGLYGRMKVFADHAQTVEEKAPHVGMSIRASGIAEAGTKKNGLPVLKELTSAESVDVVTRAGAGGMILQEAANSANSNEEVENMTKEELNRLVESGVKDALAPLRERLIRADAVTEGIRLLEGVALPASAKARIIESVTKRVQDIPTLNGELDTKKFAEALNAEAKEIGTLLSEASGAGRVFTMGAAEPSKKDLKEAKRSKEEQKESRKEARRLFESLGMPADAAKIAARGRQEVA